MSRNPHPEPDRDRLEVATDQAIAACGGDARDAVKALIVANEFRSAGPERFKDTLSYCLQSVGYGFAPASAAEFVEVLNQTVRSDGGGGIIIGPKLESSDVATQATTQSRS